MRRVLPLLLLAACGAPQGMPAPPALPVGHPSDYVVPFIGSGGFGYHVGSALPGAAAPNGMVKVGPDTKGPYGTINFLHYSGYWYGDNVVQGFSHMHLEGTGATDYGVLAFMPSDGFDNSRRGADGYGSPFQKASEQASPGSYAVTLDRGKIRAELTATIHAAHHRYTYPAGTARHVIIDLGHHLNGGSVPSAEIHLQADQGRLHGKLHSNGGMSGGYGGYDVYFVARARTPWRSALLWQDGADPAPGQDQGGQGVGADLEFDPAAGPVELQIGLSLVSEDGAAANLAAEMPGWAFDQEAAAARAAWEDLLGALRISGGSDDQRRMFYSALYRCFQMPSVQSDVDGGFYGNDRMPHQVAGYRFVTDLSLWDTYRTVSPLYALIAPKLAVDVVRSLHEMARERGYFPKWTLAGGDSGTMIGASADIVVADTYLRGVTDFDAAGAYAILRAAALDPVTPAGGRGGRDDAEDYMRLGYIPASHGGSVSLTTELGRDDFALAQLAAALGHADDAAQLMARAGGYRKLFDPAAGFLRPRNADGSWPPGAYDPVAFSDGYVEANGWQSLWMPSYDPDGLAALLGGRAGLAAKLGAMFDKTKDDYDNSDPTSLLQNAAPRPFYWAGNEPDIHAGYLFAQVGRPDLTQRWVRWILGTQYGTGPDGLPGNDDGGTMSAWYVFSALGLYPDLGTDGYIVGVPLFPKVEVRVPGGVFTVEAEGVSDSNFYIQDARLDGQPLLGPRLRQAQIKAGSTLHLVMGPMPGTWGVAH